MLNLLRVEMTKMLRHRWQVGFTLWIFPMGIFGIFLAYVFFGLLSSNLRADIQVMDWSIQFLGPWAVASDAISQLLPMAFAAAFFAGETQWGTWKNIVTRTSRTKIILTKYIAIVILVMFAFFMTTLIGLVGSIIAASILNVTLVPEFTSEILSSYFIGAVGALLSIMMMTCYVALGSLVMKSTMAGTIAGFLVAILVKMLIFPISILYNIFKLEWIPDLYRFTPGYNMDNISAWLNAGSEGLKEVTIATIRPPETPDTMLFSIVILAVWVVILLGGAIYVFNKQDISA